jgi:hypothetical protein
MCEVNKRTKGILQAKLRPMKYPNSSSPHSPFRCHSLWDVPSVLLIPSLSDMLCCGPQTPHTCRAFLTAHFKYLACLLHWTASYDCLCRPQRQWFLNLCAMKEWEGTGHSQSRLCAEDTVLQLGQAGFIPAQPLVWNDLCLHLLISSEGVQLCWYSLMVFSDWYGKLGAFTYIYLTKCSQQTSNISTIISIMQVRKQRYRKVKQITEDNEISERWGSFSNSIFSDLL